MTTEPVNPEQPPAPEQSAGWQVPPASTIPPAGAAPPAARRWRLWLAGVGLVLAGGLAGGGIAAAITHGDSDSSGTGTAAGPADAARPGGALPRFGPAGGVAGEQHITGTLTAIGHTTVTVKSSTGSATYSVTPSTQIVRNGVAATLSQLKVGDPVEVHVLPSGSATKTVERIFAGTLPAGGPGDQPDQ